MAPVARFTALALPNGLPSEVEDDPLNQELGFIYINSENKTVTVSNGDGTFQELVAGGGGSDTFDTLTVNNLLTSKGDTVLGDSPTDVVTINAHSNFESTVSFDDGFSVTDGDININSGGNGLDSINIRRDVFFHNSGGDDTTVHFENSGGVEFQTGQVLFNTTALAPKFENGLIVDAVPGAFNEGIVTSAIGGLDLNDPVNKSPWTKGTHLGSIQLEGSVTSGIITFSPGLAVNDESLFDFQATTVPEILFQGHFAVVLTPANDKAAGLLLGDTPGSIYVVTTPDDGVSKASWAVEIAGHLPNETFKWNYVIIGNRKP